MTTRIILIVSAIALLFITTTHPANVQAAPGSEPSQNQDAVATCPTTSGNSYSQGIIYQYDNDNPVRPAYNHADKNLDLRGYSQVNQDKTFKDLGSDDPIQPPQFATLFNPSRVPVFSNVYAANGWNWANPPNPGTRGSPITNPAVTVLGLQTTPGESLRAPTHGRNIGDPFGAGGSMVIYADANSITLKFTREDSAATGYTVHVDNICTDPNLLALYNSLDNTARNTYHASRPYSYNLPGLTAGKVFGTALDTEIRVAMVDTGSFMDPRSRFEWWQIAPAATPTFTPTRTPTGPTNTPTLTKTVTPTITNTPTKTVTPANPGSNVAPNATVTVSTFYQNLNIYKGSNAVDGIIGQHDNGEWASWSELNPWIQLTWSSPQTLDKIRLYDRPNLFDGANGGTLSFSDGTSVSVSGIPNDGTVKEVTFAAKTTTFVKFQVSGGTGANVGLSEMQVFIAGGPTSTNTATRTNSPTATSTPTRTNTPLPTATFTNTATFTSTPTRTNTTIGTATFTNTPTRTNTPTKTSSPTNTALAGVNVAPSATVTVSTFYQNLNIYKGSNAVDGIIGQQDNGEWASWSELNPWIQLTWPTAKTVNKIRLYDRPNLFDGTNAGTLTFSDGSSLGISGIPNDGSLFEIAFAGKTITWVKFQVTGGTGANVGLSEIQVYTGTAGPSGTPTNTNTPTLTNTPLASATNTNTPTRTNTPLGTATFTNTATRTPTLTNTATKTSTSTSTNTPTPTSTLTGTNVAPSATVTVSTYYQNLSIYQGKNAVDKIVGQHDNGEWASWSELNPWIQLTWSSSKTVNKVRLYDRPNLFDGANGGTLSFSDGSSITVSGIPNDGTLKEVTFTAKTITWVKFQVAGGTGANVGFSEIEVITSSLPAGLLAATLEPTATNTSTPKLTPTPSATSSPTPAFTDTPSPTPTVTQLPTDTPTGAPTETPTWTPTGTSTGTPTPTPTPTSTLTPEPTST